ncbi:unnamed protein product [Calypogeia fissa]
MTFVDTGAPGAEKRTEGFVWSHFTLFALMHLSVLAAVFTEVTWQAWVCCFALYGVRMFGVTAGYHRYFSHRTFKTSRMGQFVLAFLAQTSSQRGVLWWAAHHRNHHKYSDKPGDSHSPRLYGFWYSHLWWIYYHISDSEYNRVQDLSKFPELRFLDQYWLLPPIVLGTAVFQLLGWSGFLIGFALSTVLLWHGTFCINSLAHVIGTRRYNTDDDSKNSLILALITLGEGWHNNHHHNMHSTRQGFMWWEIDVTYYTLKMLEAVGLVWDIREPKEEIVFSYKSESKREAVAADKTN